VRAERESETPARCIEAMSAPDTAAHTNLQEPHMYPRRSVHLPALALATLTALAVTFGVPAAMEHAAAPAPAMAATTRAMPHTGGGAIAVAPGTIRIEVVAQRPARGKWSALMHWPTT
jgi:hypothetical protein